jgi:hypothetical protein
MKSYNNLINIFIQEGTKLAKQYIMQGKLSEDDYNQIINIDPTPTHKYVDWMAKQWVSGSIKDYDTLRNTIEEFDSFLNKGKTTKKDIYQYKTFDELNVEVDRLNQTGEGLSVKDLESDYDVVVDSEDLLIMSPHTHEASRKLGLSYFAFRSCKKGEGDESMDSAWCTTYKAPNHFNDYYYKHNVTFYYVRVKSKNLQNALVQSGYKNQFFVTAIAVLPDGKKDAYDGLDKQFTGPRLNKYLKIIGIS